MNHLSVWYLVSKWEVYAFRISARNILDYLGLWKRTSVSCKQGGTWIRIVNEYLNRFNWLCTICTIIVCKSTTQKPHLDREETEFCRRTYAKSEYRWEQYSWNNIWLLDTNAVMVCTMDMYNTDLNVDVDMIVVYTIIQ